MLREMLVLLLEINAVNMSESRTAEQPTLFDAAAEKLAVADECGAAVAESVLGRIAQFPRRERAAGTFGGGSLDSAPGQILWQGLGDAAAQVFVVYKLIHEALSNAPQFFRHLIEQFMRAQPERFGAVFTRETLWSLLAVSPKLEVPRELLNRDRIICLLHELNSRGIWRRNDGEIRREADYILSVLESNRQITEGFDALRRLQLEKANAIVRGNVLLFVPARLAQYATEVCALGEKGLLPSEEELLAKVAEFGRDPAGEGRQIQTDPPMCFSLNLLTTNSIASSSLALRFPVGATRSSR